MKLNQKGFTLMEMIIVMIVLGLLLSTSLVYLNNKSATRKLEDQTKTFINRLELVRNYATSGQHCTDCEASIAADPTLEEYGYGIYADIAANNVEYNVYVDLDGNYMYSDVNDVIIETYNFDENVNIDECENTEYCDVLFTLYEAKVFHLGTAQQDERFNLINEEGNDRDVTISGLTGKIDIL